MRVVERFSPRPHIVVDDFLRPDALEEVRLGILSVEDRLSIGMMRNGDGNFVLSEKKSNRVVFVDDELDDGSHEILARMRLALGAKQFLATLDQSLVAHYSILRQAVFPSIQLSSYGDGDHYDYHVDKGNNCNLTIVLMVSFEPRRFRGGSFVLDHEGRKHVIRFRCNRLVIFPSNTRHKVTKVNLDQGKYRDRRFSLQIWPAVGLPDTPGESEAALIASDDARHPTQPRFGVGTRELEGTRSLMQVFSTLGVSSGDALKLEEFDRFYWQLVSQLRFAVNSSLGLSHLAFRPMINRANGGRRIEVFLQERRGGLCIGYAIALADRRKPLAVELYIDSDTHAADRISEKIEFDLDLQTSCELVKQLFRRHQSQVSVV